MCDAYAAYVMNHYGSGCTIVVYGYDVMSSKTAEQQRLATQSTSADILFEMDMNTTITQKAFLANGKSKMRLIEKLLLKFQGTGIHIKQHHADADYLIVETAMASAVTDR